MTLKRPRVGRIDSDYAECCKCTQMRNIPVCMFTTMLYRSSIVRHLVQLLVCQTEAENKPRIVSLPFSEDIWEAGNKLFNEGNIFFARRGRRQFFNRTTVSHLLYCDPLFLI